MIKLQDFARECGVTDRAIQKHLKTYASELEGLYERKGSNGTWLSDEACQILRSKMKQQPIVVGDGELARLAAELEQENKSLQAELKEAYRGQAQILRENSELRVAQAKLEAAESIQLALTESRDEYKALAAKREEEAVAAHKEADRLREENAAMAAKLEKISGMGLFQWLRYRRKGE